MDRIIEVKVCGNHLTKDSKRAGVRGEANVTRLRITFDKGWDEYAKEIVFWDAYGQNPVKISLGVDYLEDISKSENIYLIPIPAEPMARAGMMTFSIYGCIDNKKQVSVSAKLEVEDSPDILQPIDPTPSEFEQMQGEIEHIKGTISRAVASEKSAAESAENAKAYAESLKGSTIFKNNEIDSIQKLCTFLENDGRFFFYTRYSDFGDPPPYKHCPFEYGIVFTHSYDGLGYFDSPSYKQLGISLDDDSCGQVFERFIEDNTQLIEGDRSYDLTQCNWTPAGAYSRAEVDAMLSGKTDSSEHELHVSDTDNPHRVTAKQVGAYTAGEVDELLTEVEKNLEGKAAKTHEHECAYAAPRLDLEEGEIDLGPLYDKDGFMSAEDKRKLDGMEAGANKSPFSHGDGKNSVTLSGNEAISENSHAEGVNTKAGTKAFKITELHGTIGGIGYYTLNSVEDIETGMRYSAVTSTAAYNCGIITAVDASKNEVAVDNFPGHALNGANDDPENYNMYNLFIIVDHPELGTIDAGFNAHTEGNGTYAAQVDAHAEGRNTKALGKFAHAEGTGTTAGHAAHSEGANTEALGGGSHAEGNNTKALNSYDHAEGRDTEASGGCSHAEGNSTKALGNCSHTEGHLTEASLSGKYSHAEGHCATASGEGSHAEGYQTIASGKHSHVEGHGDTEHKIEATGEGSHAEGYHTKALGEAAHTEGRYTRALGEHSHAEGCNTTASGKVSHAEGLDTTASGNTSHAEGFQTTAEDTAHAEGYKTRALGKSSHAEGYDTETQKEDSHAEGRHTTAVGACAHAEGLDTTAEGNTSHAEGYKTIAGDTAHAEGANTEASGGCSHAEGNSTKASGSVSHAEGYLSEALGDFSHAEGRNTKALGGFSHAEGQGTIAKGKNQHVQGKFNLVDEAGTYADIVGNGEDANSRSNAYTLDWGGNAWFAGDVTVSTPNGEVTLGAVIGDVSVALDNIIAIQTALIGGVA